MKYIMLILMMLSMGAVADQRFETNNGMCHFVTPEGFANGNDDNEVFFANCENSIRQNQNGTGSGSTMVKVKYPAGAMPFVGEYEFTGAGTGVDCVMVDSNGTQYVTQDWTASYEAEVDGLNDFRDAFGTDDSDYDYNGDGIVNGLDIGIFKSQANGKIEYVLSCFNGAQQ